MLRLSVVVAVLVAIGAPALADSDLLVTAPPKWHLDREKSAQINLASQAEQHFGAAPSIDVTEAYFPVEVGAALIVTRSSTTALPSGRDAAIAAAVAELEGWAARNDTPASPITDRTHGRAVLDGGKLLEVQVGGRDGSASTRQKFRMIIAADATKVVTVTGLCLDRDDSNADDIAACRAALATLQPGMLVTDRQTIAFPLAGETGPGASMPETPAPTTPSSVPSMSDGTKVKIGPISIPQDEPSPDRRPLYLGIGLVVLAAIFWWNRRQRDRFEGDKQPAASTREREADGDADALHDAATAEDKDAHD